MELSRYLRQHSRTIEGKAQLLMNAYAKVSHVAFTGPCIESLELMDCEYTRLWKLFHDNCVKMLVMIPRTS